MSFVRRFGDCIFEIDTANQLRQIKEKDNTCRRRFTYGIFANQTDPRVSGPWL